MTVLSWPPRRARPKLAIAIPASIVADTPHLREKTLRVGLIGRAAAIFQVEEIIVYRDKASGDGREADFVAAVLRYMETPQYLRKRIFPLKPELRYVGILPPLRTSHHPLDTKLSGLRLGSFREGLVLQSNRQRSVVDIGLDKPIPIPAPKLKVNERITVKILEAGEPPKVQLSLKNEIPFYWGYNVTVSDRSLSRSVRKGDGNFVIATSKFGESIRNMSAQLAKEMGQAKKCTILFGSPSEGLREILTRENSSMEQVANLAINAIPEQGTETVRTEEAVYATLAILNSLTPERSLVDPNYQVEKAKSVL